MLKKILFQLTKKAPKQKKTKKCETSKDSHFSNHESVHWLLEKKQIQSTLFALENLK